MTRLHAEFMIAPLLAWSAVWLWRKAKARRLGLDRRVQWLALGAASGMLLWYFVVILPLILILFGPFVVVIAMAQARQSRGSNPHGMPTLPASGLLLPAGMVSVTLALGLWLYNPGGAGAFHRAEMEAIVAHVRGLSDAPATEGTRRLRTGGYRVWYWRSDEGKVQLVVETYDGGHGPHYGFAYSDDVEPDDELSFRPPVPIEERTWWGRVDDHWWRVESWE